jgi:glycosyltransferase involved in cell wall biosynthesis
MIAPTPFFSDRGCHVRIYEEARALIAMGHRVLLVTYHLGRDMDGIPTARIGAIPWYRKLGPGPSWHKPYLDFLLFFKALATARKLSPHLIHAHLHEGAFIGILLRRVLRLPLLFDCQGSLTTEMIDHGFICEGSILHRLFLIIERIVNDRADFIITSSNAGADEIKTKWNLPHHRVEAVIDGVDTDTFRPYSKEEARRQLGLPSEGLIVVFLGVLNRYQGVDLLLEAIQLMKGRETPAHFLIMGFPEGKYRMKAESMGVGEMVTFTGRIDYTRAPLYLSAGDIAVSPKISLTEANGKLLNYMACGLPTVAFDNPVNREILGDAAVYARFEDPHDLASCMLDLLADVGRRKLLSAGAREAAVRVHSWKSRAGRISAIYRQLHDSSCH